MADANANASASEDAKCRKEDQQEGGTEIEEQQEAVASSDEVASSMSSEESDDEVSLLEVDESSLATAMENAGISIKVCNVGPLCPEYTDDLCMCFGDHIGIIIVCL